MKDQVKQVMASILGVSADAIADDATQDTLEAWDSVSHLNLVMALEQSFGVRFSDDQIMELASVAEIADAVAAAKA